MPPRRRVPEKTRRSAPAKPIQKGKKGKTGMSAKAKGKAKATAKGKAKAAAKKSKAKTDKQEDACDDAPEDDNFYRATSSRPGASKAKCGVNSKSQSILSKRSRSWSYRPTDLKWMPASFFHPDFNHDPQWVRAVAELATGLANLAPGERRSMSIVLNMWSDCAGMGSEIFAMRMLADELKMLYSIDITVNVVGVCEAKQDCRVFLEDNHKPRIISANMRDRKIKEVDGVLCAFDLNVKSGHYDQLPEGIDIYGLGFRCTPWSRCLI